MLAGSLGMLPSASLGERRTDARHVRAVRADPRLRAGHRRPRHRQPDRHDPVRGDAAADRRSARATRPGRSRRPCGRALDDGWRTADLADPADPTDGLVVVGTTGFATAVVEALEAGVRPASRHDRRGRRRRAGRPGTGRRPGHPLRHDPARRHPGREHHAVARRQAARRADARRVRDALHRGRLAGLEPQGHRVLRGRPDDALGARPAGRLRARPATAPTRPTTTRTCASWSPPRRRS